MRPSDYLRPDGSLVFGSPVFIERPSGLLWRRELAESFKAAKIGRGFCREGVAPRGWPWVFAICREDLRGSPIAVRVPSRPPNPLHPRLPCISGPLEGRDSRSLAYSSLGERDRLSLLLSQIPQRCLSSYDGNVQNRHSRGVIAAIRPQVENPCAC